MPDELNAVHPGSDVRSLDRAQNFEVIFVWLQPRLVGYLARRTWPEAAAELAGDTLYAIWRKRADVDRTAGDPQLAGLAFRIADGLLRNAERAERRRTRLVGRIRAIGGRPHSDSDVAEFVVESAEAKAAYRSLSEPDQQLVRLLLADLSTDEIAAVLAIPSGTARMRLSRLRTRLSALERHSLLEDGFDESFG